MRDRRCGVASVVLGCWAMVPCWTAVNESSTLRAEADPNGKGDRRKTAQRFGRGPAQARHPELGITGSKRRIHGQYYSVAGSCSAAPLRCTCSQLVQPQLTQLQRVQRAVGDNRRAYNGVRSKVVQVYIQYE